MKAHLTQLGIDVVKRAIQSSPVPILPRMIRTEMTKVCNLRCPGCRRYFTTPTISHEKAPPHLTVSMLEQMIREVPVKVVSFDGDGEPFCNPHLHELVRFCHEKGIRTTLCTNGTLVTKEWVEFLETHGMSRIHISIDGATPKTFEASRHTNFARVLNTCELLSHSKMQVFWQCTLTSQDVVDELLDWVDLAASFKVTGLNVMKFQQDKTSFGTQPDIPPALIAQAAERAKKHGIIWVTTCTDGYGFSECIDAFVRPYIHNNGDVYACAYMANMRTTEVIDTEVFNVPYRNYIMGNVFINSLRDIWNGQAYQALRYTLKHTRRRDNEHISSNDLRELKKEQPRRFDYCRACITRWGGAGQ
jgi:MoaA/NifB/PqqE/SkfB family radical SAM enzyme